MTPWLLLAVASGCGEPTGDAPVDASATDRPEPDAASDRDGAAIDDSGTATDAGLVTDTGTAPASCLGPERTGEGTYYDADGSGACGYPRATGGGELLVAAINLPDWEGSEVCGVCARVTGPIGEVTVRIVDQCPECRTGDLDLSPEAFDHVARRADGRVPISWREVPCDVSGPMVWHFKDGSNPWWVAIQPRDHRHRVVSLEAERAGGTWQRLTRVDYGYLLADTGLGGGPYTLRATDVHGGVVMDTGVPLLDDADHPSASQLPPCE